MATAARHSMDQVRRGLAALCLVLLTAASLFFGWRSLQGGFSAAINPGTAVLAAALCSTLLCLVRWLLLAHLESGRFQTAILDATGYRRWPAWYWLPCVPALLIGLALALPSLAWGSLAAFAACLAVAEMGSWWWWRDHLAALPNGPWGPGLLSPTQTSRPSTCEHPSPLHQPRLLPQQTAAHPAVASTSESTLHGQISERLERAPLGEIDRLSCTYTFSEGLAGTHGLHVSFCPPFLTRPQTTLQVIPASAARVRLVQLLPYGAKLEVKLTETLIAPAEVLFTATGPREDRSPVAMTTAKNQNE